MRRIILCAQLFVAACERWAVYGSCAAGDARQLPRQTCVFAAPMESSSRQRAMQGGGTGAAQGVVRMSFAAWELYLPASLRAFNLFLFGSSLVHLFVCLFVGWFA